jgi:nicotinamide-nucleotide amidase
MGTETLEESVVSELVKRKLTVAVAESSTAGLLGSRLAEVTDVSRVFLGGYITYAYAVKEKLGVPKEMLMAHGAVSEPVAAEMVIQTSKKIGSDVAVSITGIAGPAGATKDKPLGLHFIGVFIKGRDVLVRKFVFKGSRNEVRWQASQQALIMLRECLGSL